MLFQIAGPFTFFLHDFTGINKFTHVSAAQPLSSKKKKKNLPTKLTQQINCRAFIIAEDSPTKKAGGEYFEGKISIISSPTSARMAQSSRGALETWRETSALLAVFCSTAESPGPRSSLANCCVPPRALCAIKDNCANDVRRGNASPLRQTER